MQTEIFTLCEQAEQLADQFSIAKTFDSFESYKVPFNSPPCFCVVRLRIDSAVEGDGKHILSMKISNSAGRELFQTPPVEFHLSPPYEMRTLSVGFLFPIPPISFQEFGQHTISLLINRIRVASLPFSVSPRG
jgi:hypothetical protein